MEVRNHPHALVAIQPLSSEQVAGWASETAWICCRREKLPALPIQTPDLPNPSLVTIPTTPSRRQVCGTIEKGLPSLVLRVL